MNKSPRGSDRRGPQVVSMNQRSSRIALKATGGRVRAECTQFRSVQGQLKALIAPIKQRFIAAPLSEQCSENQGQHRARQHDRLRSKNAVRKRDARVSEMPYAEG